MVKSPELLVAAKAKNEARLQAYNKAVTEARLKKLLLSDVKFKVNREVDVEIIKPAMNFEGHLVEFSHDQETHTIAATIEWKITIKSGRRIFSSCSAKYHIIYDGFSDQESEILERFAFNVGRPATYTYFRSLFASLDWAAELRNPPLPVVKFFPRI